MKKRILTIVALCALAAAAFGLPGPVALFTFDQDNRSVVNQNSGAAYPVPGSAEIRPNGVSGNYLSLSRKDDSCVPLGRPFGFEGEYSISFWMRTAPGYRETGSMLLSKHQAGSYNGFWFMVNAEWGYGQTDKLTFYYSNASIVSRTSVNDGRWHHVGVAHRKSGADLYIDGRLEARGGQTTIVMPNVDFVLGGITRDRPQGSFAGDLDEVAIFDQVLGDRDFADLAGNPAWFAASGGVSVSTPAGGTMRVTLRDGRVVSIPVGEIARIEFGR